MAGEETADSGAGLEGHLRGLILSNTASSHDHPNSYHNVGNGFPLTPQASPSGSGTSSAQAHNAAAQNEPPAKHGSQPVKNGRRRPNQAQRRQMNSQFSIPIDTRPQSMSAPRPNYSPSAHHARPVQQYQRHMHSFSHPVAVPLNDRSEGTQMQGQWRGSSFSQGPPPIYNTYSPSPNHQRNVSLVQEPGSPYANRGGGQLYNYRRPYQFRPEEISLQSSLLDELSFRVVRDSEIERSEIAYKEAFRQRIEAISRHAIVQYEQDKGRFQQFPPFSIELKCFGSLSSGFATKASDMDLGLFSPLSEPQPDGQGSPIPRLLEKAFLDAGLGARLLTKTRVPIIKLCEYPPENLRGDLLAARHKFDSGIENDPHDAHDEEAQDEHANSHILEDEHDEIPMPPEGTSTSEAEFTLPCQSTGELRQFHLKQSPKHSLSSYYGLAKRVLRKAGGRDVTVSNYRDFTDRDWDILNGVGQAFIQGLSDLQLRQRLLNYPNLNLSPPDGLQNNRSLLGVYTQVDGEQILMKWENRVIGEKTLAREAQAEQAVSAWVDIQHKQEFARDPVFYTKELQLSHDKIKKASSVQLIMLEQGQHETPMQYSIRTYNIIHNLKLQNSDFTIEEWSVVVKQYVAGIFHDDIRTLVEEEVASSSLASNFKGVVRRHKSVHLAWELERALENGLYDSAQFEDVKQYISLLRSPLRQGSKPKAHPDFIVPLTKKTSELVNRIKSLPDPHRMGPNQPRDRYKDRLEFPKAGAGVQCDINFSAHLALHNTLLLRCYSHTDSRVRPMVLFVKHWAKVRGINSGYRGTLSSYGYVMMVLHYLINVAQPFVCPNLQQLAPRLPPNASAAEIESSTMCRGHNVHFWRNEEEILRLAHANQLNQNCETIGQLLRGFFEYYAQSGTLSNSNGKGFDWGRDVISLRTPGGLLTKQEKLWTGAKTVYEVQGGGASAGPHSMQGENRQAAENSPREHKKQTKAEHGKSGNIKEVRHRYLFAVEDPFELEHNVARTVTHNGIVSIRDEFRRAWKIIRSAGTENTQEDLLKDASEEEEITTPFSQLLDDIHGSEIFPDE